MHRIESESDGLREALCDDASTAATGPLDDAPKPLLLVDVDGVLSLFGFSAQEPPAGSFHAFEGIPHFLSAEAAEQLRGLQESFELVWASGWEERANENLLTPLGLSSPLPFIRFARASSPGTSLRAHWKLDAIERYASARPLAWIDDAFNLACEQWALAREPPTLLLPTDPGIGLTAEHSILLARWAAELRAEV
jgi:HAD domain in Swiss Army Knife RNA repair proteins